MTCYGAGSLAIAARRAGPRTIVERVRYDGISRCSRAFRRGDAALVVLSQLGPGVVRGDSVSTTGHVRAGAHLIVTQQTSTRLLGGAHRSRASATWAVDEGAVLELVAEPLIAAPDARYAAETLVDLGAGARVLISDLAFVPAEADVRLRISVRQSGRELFFDALDAAAAAPHAVGTFALVGLEEARIGPVIAALDGAMSDLSDVRLGIGALNRGAFVRMLATDLWAIRTALAVVREAAWNALHDPAHRAIPPGQPGSLRFPADSLRSPAGSADRQADSSDPLPGSQDRHADSSDRSHGPADRHANLCDRPPGSADRHATSSDRPADSPHWIETNPSTVLGGPAR